MKCFIFLFVAVTTMAATTFAGDSKRGEKLFTSHSCFSCHSIGSEGTSVTGPNLAGVTKLRNDTWLKKWIQHPELMTKDPSVVELSKKYPSSMPNLGVNESDAADMIAFLKRKDSKPLH
jgi:nitrous-oxide reductase